MCIAIPLGPRDGHGGTRLGRWLREQPLRIARLAAMPLVLGGALHLALAPTESWTVGALLLGQGLVFPLMGEWLTRLPHRCQVSELAYPRHVAIALLVLGGGAALLAGNLGLTLGGVLCALAWRLAAKPLRWQLHWCRGRPPERLLWIPRLMNAVAALLLAMAVASFAGLDTLRDATIPLFGALFALMGGLYLASRGELA